MNKPFTSETLIKTIETYIPKSKDKTKSDAKEIEEAPEEIIPDAALDETLESTTEFAHVSEEIVPEEQDSGEKFAMAERGASECPRKASERIVRRYGTIPARTEF